jgi:hypothetical protein
MAKWNLDAPQQILVGKLVDVHRSDTDDDTSVNVQPDPTSALLRNRAGHKNANGWVECEINVGSAWRADYEGWVSSLLGRTVTAHGVFVEDTEHDDKTELHPLDLVFAAVGSSHLPGDWIGSLASQQHLTVGTSLLAVRFAAASDDRDDDRPPLSNSTRAATFTLPFPPHPQPPAHEEPAALPGVVPGVVPRLAPLTRMRLGLQAQATIATHVRAQGTTTVLDVTVTCLGRDHGGPGAIAGEIVTFWGEPTARILVTPQLLSFGTVPVGEVADRSFSIESVGELPLHVTIAGSPVTNPFHWPSLDTQLAPGTSHTVTVEFIARGVGQVTGSVPVLSSAGGGPLAVALSARAIKGIVPR